ncbi:MAG: DUF4350 domain-containing protein [Altibacter sp.]|nr:DUF4350 domain-containing protein [Altibacter sp.]
MTKLQQLVFFGLLLMVAALVYLEATRPLPVNWFPSYTQEDKIPLGTYVMHDVLKKRLGEDLVDMRQPPFENLRDTSLSGTYLFVNNNLSFDDAELERMYAWVAKGNTVFAAATFHSTPLLDTLQLETKNAWLPDVFVTEPMLQLVNKNFKEDKPYHVQRDMIMPYFSELDTLSQTVLGVSEPYNDTLQITKPLINFIKAPVGKGAFYLHTQPEVFSNYFLLTEQHIRYTEDMLGYINDGRPVYWDTHYKSGKSINISPLYILLNNKYLKWAYYTVLIGAVLFVLFEGKRKQRSIPIVNPVTNKTFEYTQTISGMYLDQQQTQEIAKKQITLFFEYIRTRLRIPTDTTNNRFFTAVAARSGNSLEDTKNLFTFMEKIQQQEQTSKEELLELNKRITTYKKTLDGKS